MYLNLWIILVIFVLRFPGTRMASKVTYTKFHYKTSNLILVVFIELFTCCLFN